MYSCSLCFLGLPRTHSSPLASASHLLGLQVSVNILLVIFLFFMYGCIISACTHVRYVHKWCLYKFWGEKESYPLEPECCAWL